jgi:hypothetical protein
MGGIFLALTAEATYTGVPKFCMWSCSCLTAHSSVNKGRVSSLGNILLEGAHRGDLATTSGMVAQWRLAAAAAHTQDEVVMEVRKGEGKM